MPFEFWTSQLSSLWLIWVDAKTTLAEFISLSFIKFKNRPDKGVKNGSGENVSVLARYLALFPSLKPPKNLVPIPFFSCSFTILLQCHAPFLNLMPLFPPSFVRQEGKQYIKPKAVAIKCCKKRKITHSPL